MSGAREAILLSALMAAGCSNPNLPHRRGVIQDVDGCEMSHLGQGWMSVDRGDMVYLIRGNLDYTTLRVLRAPNAEALSADVLAGRVPQYADDQAVPETRPARIPIGGHEYPALWLDDPNIAVYVFVEAQQPGYVFVLRLELASSGKERTEDRKMRRVGRLLRPVVRSLLRSPVDSYRQCVPGPGSQAFLGGTVPLTRYRPGVE